MHSCEQAAEAVPIYGSMVVPLLSHRNAAMSVMLTNAEHSVRVIISAIFDTLIHFIEIKILFIFKSE